MGAENRPGLSGTDLKRVACVCMLLDHAAAALLEGGVFGPLLPGTPLRILDLVLRWGPGRLAFPLYAFLLTEGFCRTRSVKRYAARLAVFALLSEAPFKWAFRLGWTHQNVYFTLALGVGAMCFLRRCDDDGRPTWRGWLGTAACAAAASLMRADYGAQGVLLIASLYVLRGNLSRQCRAGALLMFSELTAPLAFLLVWHYNGQRGKCSQAEKWAYYWFYPAHLIILGAMAQGMMR